MRDGRDDEPNSLQNGLRTAPRATVIAMTRRVAGAICVAASWAALVSLAADEPGTSALAGSWVLNRSLSEMPREMAFRPDWIADQNSGGSSGSIFGRRALSGRTSPGLSGNVHCAPTGSVGAVRMLLARSCLGTDRERWICFPLYAL